MFHKCIYPTKKQRIDFEKKQYDQKLITVPKTREEAENNKKIIEEMNNKIKKIRSIF